MMMRGIAALLVAAPLAAAAAEIASHPHVPPYLPVPKGAAVIMNTGSTNTSAYRIVVQERGSVEYVADSGRDTATIPLGVARNFFRELRAAAPLQNIARVPCMKSASFGTSLYVWWNRERSPDLSCPADARGRALAAGAEAIAQALHLKAGMHAPIMRPMLPGEQHKALPPAPSPSP